MNYFTLMHDNENCQNCNYKNNANDNPSSSIKKFYF